MDDNTAVDRNPSIDFIKGIAALMVCYQHSCGEEGVAGYLLAIARSAVPLFIMITGYLYPDTLIRGKQKEQIVRFLRISIQIVAL